MYYSNTVARTTLLCVGLQASQEPEQACWTCALHPVVAPLRTAQPCFQTCFHVKPSYRRSLHRGIAHCGQESYNAIAACRAGGQWPQLQLHHRLQDAPGSTPHIDEIRMYHMACLSGVRISTADGSSGHRGLKSPLSPVFLINSHHRASVRLMPSIGCKRDDMPTWH